jgi:hypothetical protein
MIRRSASTSTLASTMTRRPPVSSISIRRSVECAVALLGESAADAAGPSSATTTLTRPASDLVRFAAKALRQVTSRERDRPYRRAVAATKRGSDMLSKTIRAFSSSDQRRRRPVSTTSSRFSALIVWLSIRTVLNHQVSPPQGGSPRRLTLKGRAAPALASLDRAGRVIHIGSFSKTISPTLRLGFLVAPISLLSRFAEVAACLAPPPGPSVQLATAEFMREGHYLRHLRRTKRAYSAQRDALLECLQLHVKAASITTAGLAVLLRLPDSAPDTSIARETLAFGMAPAALSTWYARPASGRSGLLLGIATAPKKHLARSCDRLCGIIERFGSCRS